MINNNFICLLFQLMNKKTLRAINDHARFFGAIVYMRFDCYNLLSSF